MSDDPGGDLRPHVGVVVVNFHGDDDTLACVEALSRSEWPADRLTVVVVDNGSSTAFRDQVVQRPSVQYLESPGNIGFPGACNLGVQALLETSDVIGLINNDAVPDQGWLAPLVAELLRDERIGGVTPRIVLANSFVRLTFRSGTRRAGAGDARQLGVQLSGVRVGGRALSDAIELGAGFWGWETGEPAGRFSWTAANATALVATGGYDDRVRVGPVEVRMSSVLGPVRVEVDAGNGMKTVDVTEEPHWEVVAAHVTPVGVVNSTGIELHQDGSCGDRDYFELEDTVSSTPPETFACSGAAVLFRAAFLRDVGPMDHRFFLYYEDVDLCWRGRLRGWTFRYVPASVVQHRHSATVGSGSRLATHLAERNRLLMLTKVAPGDLALRAIATTTRNLGRAVRQDVLKALVARRRPDVEHVAAMTRILLGFVRHLPHALATRIRLGRRSIVDRRRSMVLS